MRSRPGAEGGRRGEARRGGPGDGFRGGRGLAPELPPLPALDGVLFGWGASLWLPSPLSLLSSAFTSLFLPLPCPPLTNPGASIGKEAGDASKQARRGRQGGREAGNKRQH